MTPLLASPLRRAYAFVGSSTRLSVFPESTTALMTATALGTLGSLGVSDPSDKTLYAAGLAMLVGLLCGGLGRPARFRRAEHVDDARHHD